jgi:prolipoprotein diacylglyceryl transferase
VLTHLVASIPSPGGKQIEIGPLNLRAYGLMIALGVFAAVWLAQKRWAERGHDPEDFVYVAMRAVPAGLIGARLYHVITDWRTFEGRWEEAFYIWRGGLGIPGGMLAGVLVGVWAARRRGMPLPDALDAAAPALPLAQAIGRLGNWFNQEVFGKPTDLPWGLEIDAENRPLGYIQYETFHPTFLYELLWNLALCGFLLWIDSRRVIRRGYLIAVYVLGYATGRLWIELLRIDRASEILGVRVNVWTSTIAILVSLAVLVRSGVGRVPTDGEAGEAGDADETPAAVADEPSDAASSQQDEPDLGDFADLAAIPETDEVILPEDDPEALPERPFTEQ